MQTLDLYESIYAGQRVALLTQHGKQTPLGEVLSEKLGTGLNMCAATIPTNSARSSRYCPLRKPARCCVV